MEEYLAKGKFGKYLKSKSKELPSSVAQIALDRLIPKGLPGS